MDSQDQKQVLFDDDEAQAKISKKKKYKILILGASYGSLLATKLILAGHDVTLVCRASTAALFNEQGSIVLMPMRRGGGGGGDGESKNEELLEIRSKDLSSSGGGGTLTACTPESLLEVAVAAGDESSLSLLSLTNRYDLAVLAMQEPQYSAPGVRELVVRIAQDALPTMAITNMPLLPYLKRIIHDNNNVDILENDDDAIRSCFTEPDLWTHFCRPDLFTQCSPDPQAFRPHAESQPNVLQVRLPTNFKAAKFGASCIKHTEMLKNIERDIEAARFFRKTTVEGADDESSSSNTIVQLQIPVKLRVHDSLYVPLAKWAMLLAGNYRCVQTPFAPNANLLSIQQAIWSNIDESRAVYDWVVQVCINLGRNGNSSSDNINASLEDFVPFEKYAAAAKSLTSPSSAARALAAGASSIERVDKLVLLLAAKQGKANVTVTATVAAVDAWLAHNQNKKKNEKAEAGAK
jgi:hypothetical protein